MTSPDIKNLIVYNSSNDISYIEYNRPGLPYKFDATYIYHSNENYNDGSYSSQLGTISNNLIIESATSNILLSTPANKKVIVKANMAVNASLDVSNSVTTYRLNSNDICLNNILYLNSSLTENVFGDLKINGSISQIAASNEEIAGFTSNNASLTTSTFAFGDISLSDIFTSNIYSSTITNSYISNTAIGYNSDNISFPTKAVFTDVSLVSLTLDTSVNGASYIKFNNNSNSANSTIIKTSDDYSKLDINKPLKIGFGTVSNISVFNGDISCNTLYYSQLNPDIKLNNYFDVSIGHVSVSGNIIPTLNNTFSIGSSTNKFNTITSTLFIGNLFGACTLANDLVKNLDMSFNNLDISGTIRLGGVDLNQTLQGSYLTISGANVSFNAVNSRINELSANVYSRELIDICLNTNYIRNRVFDLSFQDISGRLVDLSRNVYSRAFIDLCLNTNFVRVNNSTVSQFRIFDNRFIFESSGNYIQQIASGYNSTIISEWRTNWLSSNNPVLRFHSDGSITNLTNSYATWSDIRLKENIVNTSPKLQDLLKVRVVNYNLKGTLNANSNKHIGVIAQELEQIFPDLIDTHELSQEDINAGLNEGYKSVKYSCFSVILIKALQEEHEIINKLNTRIEALNEDCNSIKDLIEDTNLMSASINILKEENVILKYKLDEILTKLEKSVIV